MAKLKIGVLVDSQVLPAWALSMLERIAESDYAEISLVVLNRSMDPGESVRRRIRESARHLLFFLYAYLDRRIAGIEPDALESLDARQTFAGVPVVEVRATRTEGCDRIPLGDVERIRAHDLDVLIRLGSGIPRGEILAAARHGVWSCHHGIRSGNHGYPFSAWEALRDEPVTGSVIEVLSEPPDDGRILLKSYSATENSMAQNHNKVYWKCAFLMPRELERLHRLGSAAFFGRVGADNRHVEFNSDRLMTEPTNGQFLALFLRFLARYARYRFDAFFYFGQWILLFDMRASLSTTLRRFRRVVPPKDRFWADPLAVYREGKYYIFLEEFLFSKNKGHISVLVVDEKGNYGQPVTVLDSPYHMSYPFVFEWRGDYYMIPETSSKRTIELYRAREFPGQWEFQKNLMENVLAVDATMFPYGGRWWLFTNMAANDNMSKSEELFLFHADTPLSDNWHSHPLNPVVSDVTRSRPAGPLIEIDGKVYRPSQDCSRGYGYGVRINHVMTLTENEYREEEADFIEPRWDPQITGLHTMLYSRELTLFDAKFKRLKRMKSLFGKAH